MARIVASTIVSQITSANVRPILMAELEFDSGVTFFDFENDSERLAKIAEDFQRLLNHIGGGKKAKIVKVSDARNCEDSVE